METDDNAPVEQTIEGYDILAEKADDLDRTASPWGSSYFQRHYSWPATRTVLPELSGRRVLLAGCGRGDHVPWFHENGATVTGVDVSATAIQHAKDEFGDEGTFHRADLTEPLDFANDSLDVVFSNLVFSHIEEWRPVFSEFRRILEPDGTFVVTTIHPRYLRTEFEIESYYETKKVMNEWPEVDIPTYYRPISEVISSFLGAGFHLQTVEEPKPEPQFEDHHPKRYRDALREPELLVIRAAAN
ncbi:hypothetical protein BG842_15150 [Haladaptatus sp. W1]|uniref:class I SAM-dependent methyltransferase n=1 Tax=Haladaptatus sp. W1 TaxID=1897478 RepID=UPI000849AD4F|nr:class I SAM-dependent methyltransferase [Haladaptatus sp. W1]ODR81611.1 hypothetical protein BG842_25285 [Haladaptatus sp. W1]ODR81633.1 hypothetical protein BG842_15150 [Haladaptatus sp. W1]